MSKRPRSDSSAGASPPAKRAGAPPQPAPTLDRDSCPAWALEVLSPSRFGTNVFHAKPADNKPRTEPFPEHTCGFNSSPDLVRLRSELCGITPTDSGALALTGSAYQIATRPHAEQVVAAPSTVGWDVVRLKPRPGRVKTIEVHDIPTTADELRSAPSDVVGDGARDPNNRLGIQTWNLVLAVSARPRLGDRGGRSLCRTEGEDRRAVCTRIPGMVTEYDHSSTAQPVPIDIANIRAELFRASDDEAFVQLGSGPRPARVGHLDPEELLARVKDTRLDVNLSRDVLMNVFTSRVTPTDAHELLSTQYGAHRECVFGETCFIMMLNRRLLAQDWLPEGQNLVRPPCRAGMAYLDPNDRRIVERVTRDGETVQYRTEYALPCLMCIRYIQAKEISMAMAGVAHDGGHLNAVVPTRTTNILSDRGYKPSECFPVNVSLACGAYGPIRMFDLEAFIPEVEYVDAAPCYGGRQPVMKFREPLSCVFDRAALSVPHAKFTARPTCASLREGMMRMPLTVDKLIAAMAANARSQPPVETQDVGSFLARSLRVCARDLREMLLAEIDRVGNGPTPEGLLPVEGMSVWARVDEASRSKRHFDSMEDRKGKKHMEFSAATGNGSPAPTAAGAAGGGNNHDADDDDGDNGDLTAEDMEFVASLTNSIKGTSFSVASSRFVDMSALRAVHALEKSPPKQPVSGSDVVTLDASADPPMNPPVQIARFHTDAAVRTFACPWVYLLQPILIKILAEIAATTSGAAAHCLFLCAIMRAKYAEHLYRRSKGAEDIRLAIYHFMDSTRLALGWFVERVSYGHPINDVHVLRDLQNPLIASGRFDPGGVYNALLPVINVYVPRPLLHRLNEKYPRALTPCQRQGTRGLLLAMAVVPPGQVDLFCMMPFTEAVRVTASDSRAWDCQVQLVHEHRGHLASVFDLWRRIVARASATTAAAVPTDLWTWKRLGRTYRTMALVVCTRLAVVGEALSRVPPGALSAICEDPLAPIGSCASRTIESDHMTMRVLASRRFRCSLASCVTYLGGIAAELAKHEDKGADDVLPLFDGDALHIPSDASMWAGDIPCLLQVYHACGLLCNDSSQFSVPKATRGAGMATLRMQRKERSVAELLKPAVRSLSQRDSAPEWNAEKLLADAESRTREDMAKDQSKRASNRMLSRYRRKIARAISPFKNYPRRRARKAPPVSKQPAKKQKAQPAGRKRARQNGGPRRRNFPGVGTSAALLGDSTIPLEEPNAQHGFSAWFGGDRITMSGIVRLASVLFTRESLVAGSQATGTRDQMDRLIQTVCDLATTPCDRILVTFMTTALLTGLGGLYPWSRYAADAPTWVSLQAYLQGSDARSRLAEWITNHPAISIVCFRQAFVYGLTAAPTIVATMMAAGRPEIHQFAKGVVQQANLIAKAAATGEAWGDIEEQLSKMLFDTPENEVVIRPMGISAKNCVLYVCGQLKVIRNNADKAAASVIQVMMLKKEKLNATIKAQRRNEFTKTTRQKSKRTVLAAIKARIQQATNTEREVDAAISAALKILDLNPSRALSTGKYSQSLEKILVHKLMSGTRPGVLPGSEIIYLITRLRKECTEADAVRMRRAYEAVIATWSRTCPVGGPTGSIAAIDALPNHLWTSMMGFLKAFHSWADVQPIILGASDVVAEQRLARLMACSQMNPEKGVRPPSEAFVSLATCFPQFHTDASKPDSQDITYIPSRVSAYTHRRCCKIGNNYLAQGAQKNTSYARGPKETTYDPTTDCLSCKFGPKKERTQQRAQDNRRKHAGGPALGAGLALEVARKEAEVRVADSVVAANSRIVDDANAAVLRNITNKQLYAAARAADVLLGRSRETAAQAQADLEAAMAELEHHEATSLETKPDGPNGGGGGGGWTFSYHESNCRDFAATDTEALGTGIVLSRVRHAKQARRNKDVVFAAACCPRYVAIDLITFFGHHFACPVCVLPLKRRGVHGTGAVSTSASTIAAAAAVNASLSATPNGPVLHNPWRDFQDRICIMGGCDKPADRSSPLTVFSRGLSDDGPYVFVDGYLCEPCASLVAIALKKDNGSASLNGLIIPRDFLPSVLATGNSTYRRHMAHMKRTFR